MGVLISVDRLCAPAPISESVACYAAKLVRALGLPECCYQQFIWAGRWPDGSTNRKSGRLVIDRAKVKAEANLGGKYLLATSDLDLSPGDTALGYKNLLEADHGPSSAGSNIASAPTS
jgi:hypothetical protein